MFSTNQKRDLDISQPMGKGKLDVFHQSETRSRYFSTNGDRQAGYLSINQLDAIEIFLPQLSHFSLIKTWLNIRWISVAVSYIYIIYIYMYILDVSSFQN